MYKVIVLILVISFTSLFSIDFNGRKQYEIVNGKNILELDNIISSDISKISIWSKNMLKYININYSYSKENLILLEIPNEMLSKEDEFRLKIDYFDSSSDVSTNYFYLNEKQVQKENLDANRINDSGKVVKYILDRNQLLDWLGSNEDNLKDIYDITTGRKLSEDDLRNEPLLNFKIGINVKSTNGDIFFVLLVI